MVVPKSGDEPSSQRTLVAARMAAPRAGGYDVVFACFDNELRGAAASAGLQTWPGRPPANQ